MNVRPLQDRTLVSRLEEERSAGGIIIPDKAKKKPVEGMQFDRGYLSPYFVTDAEKMEVELEEPIRQIVNNAGPSERGERGLAPDHDTGCGGLRGPRRKKRLRCLQGVGCTNPAMR